MIKKAEMNMEKAIEERVGENDLKIKRKLLDNQKNACYSCVENTNNGDDF